MKEILYIQAGSLANYVGTHFWNTQENYFTYGSDSDGEDYSLVSNDVSFREGIAYNNEPIFYPRLLAFDRKANFGTLSQRSALTGFNDGDPESGSGPSLWNGNVIEYKQDPIPESKYHNQIQHDYDHHQDGEPEVRYWSDFNRLYYAPKTVQRLPDIADWENAEGNWQEGRDTFKRFDEETTLMENSLRAFVEECDTLQGIQLIHDTATFGSFIDSFLTSFRDEFSKLSVLSFDLLSDSSPASVDVNDHSRRRKVLNDALCLRSINELRSMSIPVQSPLSWPTTIDGVYLDVGRSSLYHTSALLSAHFESATLPLRMRGTHEDLTSFTSQLNWRGITRFAELTGRVSGSSGINFDQRMFNYTTLDSAQNAVLDFTRRDVSRGFTLPDMQAYKIWCSNSTMQETFISSTHAPPYPLPNSFPRIFTSNRSRTMPLFTSMSTTPRTSSLFRSYARFIEANLGMGGDEGMNRDEMKELGNDLWRICDGFGDSDGPGGEEDDNRDELGEDE
ncbi:hypothetical protein PILCRDRAFT_767219 [Piloderma croceum F 1598]|uniref:Tubulin nucleotide-binding domain-like protein n=1 Tax=Piloderma croceum (strain F 1598) TaxID=765440 RepID=A0A0C3CJ78_PILCF|nr:hypothetical protein PILCRDRAFT_767219 [Piloderma croceum F 1598]